MSALNLDRETALRIALASRALPGINITDLIGVLMQRLGSPLTVEALSRITVTHLKTGLGSPDGEEDGEDIGIGLDAMKLAVRILWGETGEEGNIPVVPTYADELQDAIRVAISSNNGTQLDGHFGSCLRYLIYQVTPQAIRLMDVRSSIEADIADDRNLFRVNLIKDCAIVYMVSIGGPAAAKVINSGIYPMKRVEGGEAEAVLQELQAAMLTSPPPWLSKILGVSQQERLKNYRGDSSDD
ncbi:MAG: dinitrogenase iron-molybdenum cofactor biosynthesis protein [Thiothrix lacustris]|uniref:Dinitrogenase iron-molybdenum cofactor biosynthesis protein n=1 Tax=Thiothrix lacustris TaxID=525917 RepID=A0A1Y1QME2_9GAMM|nr:MAG: dinitrogenase iron-molybdenum cofactor biosynthesis protein [Thiothrix lacustris]